MSLLIIHSKMTSRSDCGLHVTQMAWMHKFSVINQRNSKRIKAYCLFATSMFSVHDLPILTIYVCYCLRAQFSSVFVFTVALKNHTYTLSHTCYEKKKKQCY